MRNKMRVAFLVLAGLLTVFAAREAKAECEDACWDDGAGHVCCTTSYCVDICW